MPLIGVDDVAATQFNQNVAFQILITAFYGRGILDPDPLSIIRHFDTVVFRIGQNLQLGIYIRNNDIVRILELSFPIIRTI